MTASAATISCRGLRAVGDYGFALGPIDLDVQAGTLTSVVGTTGAGKSLLLFALAGLVPSTGEACIAGTRVGPRTLRTLRPKIGLSFQRDALALNRTAFENVRLAVSRGEKGEMLPAKEADERAWQALAEVGMSDAGHKLPSELSGGMRRRVGLARALAPFAPVLLLDDATAGLDPSTAAEVLERMVMVARKRPAAVLLVTGDVDTALIRSEQVLVLEQGRALFCGAPSALATQSGLDAFAPREHRAC